MRTLAIGDIHGCLRALDTLLDQVSPTRDDRIVTLGDYVDRGPDSRGVLDRLLDLQATGQLIPLRGNHDEMMVNARDHFDHSMWLACGGKQTLASYGISDLEDIPEEHWAFLEETCRNWYETDRHFFVHANAYPDIPLPEQPLYMLLWEKLLWPCCHESGKVMICGHTVQAGGRPIHLGTTICLDTGVYHPFGWLTCLDVVSGKYWQANQQGEHRSDWLQESDEVG
jgi:serine/threonine protein phosphatase 1